jgi:hypothetical protein
MSEFGIVRRETENAIRQAVSEALNTIEKNGLFGFGLCTDDSVSGVYHVYATSDWVAEREADYPEIGLISVEWEQESDKTHFDRISDRLFDWAEADELAPQSDYDRDRTLRFRALVEAMMVCRDEGLFDEQTLLSICDTDPDDLMEKLTCDAARQLNSKGVAEAYCQMMGC